MYETSGAGALTTDCSSTWAVPGVSPSRACVTASIVQPGAARTEDVYEVGDVLVSRAPKLIV